MQPITLRGTVTGVLGVGTLEVRLAGGTTEMVQLMGLDGPAAGTCGYAQATADSESLARGKLAWVVGDPAEPRRDGRGRLVGYVILPGGLDVGLQLIRRGDATARVDGDPFKKLTAYASAEAAARRNSEGIWACGHSPTPGKPPHGHRQPEARTPKTSR